MQTSLNMKKNAKMRTQTKTIRKNEPLHFRHVGKGFIVAKTEEGFSLGRKLAKTFTDQYNRQYVQVNGEMELVTANHCYLAAD